MEVCSKNDYKDGVVQLRPNVKADISHIGGDVLALVHADDEHYMIQLLNYCGTTIGRKNKDITACIIPVQHRETGAVMFYTVYVSLPLSTVFRQDQLSYLKELVPARITKKSIEIRYVEKMNPPIWRMEIIVNSLKTMPTLDSILTTNIQIDDPSYRSLRIADNTSYHGDNHKESDGDHRGSTKRTRTSYENEK